jgi:hypothetical protein
MQSKPAEEQGQLGPGELAATERTRAEMFTEPAAFHNGSEELAAIERPREEISTEPAAFHNRHELPV